jgi:hypothetical protein
VKNVIKKSLRRINEAIISRKTRKEPGLSKARKYSVVVTE